MKKSNFSIIKLILFIMFFLIILVFFLLLYIIPMMKKYKTNEYELKKYEKIYRKQANNIKHLKKKEKLLSKTYRDSILKFQNNFNKKDFEKFVKKYIKNIKISSVNNQGKFLLEGNINNLSKFTDFIEGVRKYKNIIKVEFPISIKKVEKSYKISFYVTVINKQLKNNL